MDTNQAHLTVFGDDTRLWCLLDSQSESGRSVHVRAISVGNLTRPWHLVSSDGFEAEQYIPQDAPQLFETQTTLTETDNYKIKIGVLPAELIRRSMIESGPQWEKYFNVLKNQSE